mgnify:CR=1 FL=1
MATTTEVRSQESGVRGKQPLPCGRGSDNARGSDFSAPLFGGPLILHPIEMVEYQRGQIRRREYTPLGRLERIDLGEGCLPNTAPDNPLIGRWSAREHPIAPALDWLNHGPLLGLSKDEQDILVCSHMIHPPPMVDPDWRRKIPTPLKIVDGIPQLDQPATIEQSLLHRCWVGPGGRWVKGAIQNQNGKKIRKWVPTGEWFLPGTDGEEWMLFQPVSQILCFLVNGGFGILNCRADEAGRHTVLLYDRKREEGHILFGRKDFQRHFEVMKSV